jgi:hypothetical protein
MGVSCVEKETMRKIKKRQAQQLWKNTKGTREDEEEKKRRSEIISASAFQRNSDG